MFSSKEGLNELENESLTATGSLFREIITAPSRRIDMENLFIAIHTPNLSSVVLIEHLWAQHLLDICAPVDLKAKVVLWDQRSAVDLNINTAGLCCAVVASLTEYWTMVQIWGEKNNCGRVLWNHDEGSGLDKQKPVHALSQVWFALTLPGQYCVLREQRGWDHRKHHPFRHQQTFKQRSNEPHHQ